MIDRYARPRMKAVWSDKAKYDKWLAVELAVCEAWADEGVIPAGDMAKLRGASYDADRLNDILRETRHDMAAFLQATTESLGDEGRWVHLGLTTSDVWDTATGLQLMDACDLLDEGIGTVLDRLRERALEHRSTLMMGRTHGIHAEPITFGLKMALWWDEMRRARKRLSQAREMVSVGKISGPVGGYATVSPAIEERVCRRLGIAPAPVSNQIVQRDRHAQYVGSLALIAASLEKFATEIRGLQRTEVREVSEPFPKGQPGSSSMPHKRNPELSERICGLSRLIRGHSTTALENVALWGERGHQPLIGRAGDTARLVDGPGLHPGDLRRHSRRHARRRRADEAQPGVQRGRDILPAGCCWPWWKKAWAGRTPTERYTDWR